MDAYVSVAAPNSTVDGVDSSLFISAMPTSWSGSILLGLFVGYVALCSLFRFSRINSLRSKLGYHDRASLSRMTNQDAFEITSHLARFEFPLFYDLSVRLALFEVYSTA